MSKILCTLCKNVLKHSDDVYSTSCGHIFHFICLRESQSRSTCCPQCHHFNASTYKMYLMFDENKDENLPNDCNDNLRFVELQKEIEDSYIKYSHLQNKYLDSLDSVHKLEERLKISNRSISQRAVVFSELEERIKTLEELNEYLTIDTECKSKALTAKSIEIEELQKSLKDFEKSDCVTSGSYVKLKKIEEKFENLTIQLDKEISNSTKLSIDNKKLEKYIELMKTETECRVDVKSDNANLISNLTEYTKNSLSNSEDTAKNHKKLPQNFIAEKIKENDPKTTILQNSAVNSSFKQTRSQDHSNSYTLPKNEFKYPTANESQNLSEKNSSKEDLTQNNKIAKKISKNTAENNSLKSIRQDEVLSSTDYYLKNSTENVHKLAGSSNLPRNPSKTENVLENTSINLPQIYPINELNLSNNRTILIKNFPKNEIQYPLKNCIVSLSCIREGYIYLNDVSRVYIKDHNRKKYHKLPQKITLIVEFKNADIKTKFLLNKVQIIQMFPSVELIDTNNFNSISEIVDNTNENDSKPIDQPLKPSVNNEVTSIGTTMAGKNTTSVGINDFNSKNNHILLINNFPKNKIQYPLKNLIVALASTKEGHIYMNDISEVYIKDNNGKKHHQLPQNIALIVEFKNDDIKTKFLLNQVQILQMFPTLELTDPNYSKHIPDVVDTINKNDSNSSDQLPSKTACSTSIISPATTMAEEGPEAVGSKKQPINELNSSNNHSLLIKNFSKENIQYPLKNLIVSMASNKKGYIDVADVNKVQIKNRNGKKHNQLPPKITLFIEFKNLDIKTKFLMNQNQIHQIFPLVELVDLNEDILKSSQDSQSKDLVTKSSVEETQAAVVSKNQSTNEFNSSNNHSLIINNFPKEKLQYPLKNAIVSLAIKKEGYISEDDVSRVYIKDRNGRKHYQLPQKITLIVEFRNPDVKTKFLLNQDQIYQMYPLLELIDTNNNKGRIETHPKTDQPVVVHSVTMTATKTTNKENHAVVETPNVNNANHQEQRQRTPSAVRTSTNNKPSAVSTTNRNYSDTQVQRSNSTHLATTSLTDDMFTLVEISRHNNSKQLCERQRSVSSARSIDSNLQGQRQRTLSSARTSTNNNSSAKNMHRNDLNPHRQRSNSVYTALTPLTKAGIEQTPADLFSNRTNLKPLGQRQRSASLAKTTAGKKTSNDISPRVSTTNRIDLKRNGHRPNSLHSATKHNGQLQRSASLARSTATTRTDNIRSAANRNNSNFHDHRQNPVNLAAAISPASMTSDELAAKYAIRHGYQIKDVNSVAMQSPATLNIAAATAIEDLLIYAREKLRGNGFEYVFRQNNEVMALKNRNDFQGIKIMNQNHVNELLLSHPKK